MRLVRASLFGSLVLFLAACAPGHTFPALDHTPTQTALLDAVVVLADQSEEGPIMASCSGFFISEVEVVTAAHCVQRTELMVIEIFPGLVIEMEGPSEASPIGDVHDVALHSQVTGAVVQQTQRFVVVGYDRDHDVALLQADEELPAHTVVRVHEGAAPQIGDRVLAVGHPLGMLYNVTEGIVSRDMSTMEPLIEGDTVYVFSSADVYFGNSGGPLFNAQGEVIGVCSWIADSQSHLGGWVSYETLNAFLATVVEEDV